MSRMYMAHDLGVMNPEISGLKSPKRIASAARRNSEFIWTPPVPL